MIFKSNSLDPQKSMYGAMSCFSPIKAIIISLLCLWKSSSTLIFSLYDLPHHRPNTPALSSLVKPQGMSLTPAALSPVLWNQILDPPHMPPPTNGQMWHLRVGWSCAQWCSGLLVRFHLQLFLQPQSNFLIPRGPQETLTMPIELINGVVYSELNTQC